MITRCAVCRTWFQVAPESLHAVHGLVRCGKCGTVFNALATLRSEPPVDENPDSAPAEDVTPPFPASAGADAAPPEPLLLAAWSAKPGVRLAWATAAGVLALILAGQLINAGRHEVARWPVAGPLLSAVYRTIGHPLTPVLALSELHLEDTELVGLRRKGRVLELRGVLVNRAVRDQPLPWLSLRLTDRYGAVVASRLLAPQDYGAGPQAGLRPGVGYSFDVKLADPGPQAVGFTLSPCKPVGREVRCRP